ncbi:MAG: isopeptide-forming domain-containing fimbrial protein, partial [Gammaproteobacteria bacterium]
MANGLMSLSSAVWTRLATLFSWGRSGARTGGGRVAAVRFLSFAFLLSMASSAHAGAFCSDSPFFGTIDGFNATHLAALDTQITIDTDCTFKNFPASNPLTVTLNFQTNDPSVYLITFDNVVFTGNMACANIDHRIWFVNGSDYGSGNSCQDLFIPVEAISKQNPPATTTVGIGEPFTYTLTIPVLYDPATGTYLNNFGSENDLHSITIRDDLNATGADLTLVGTPTVTWVSDGSPVPHTFVSNDGGVPGNLKFEIDPASNPGVIIPKGEQIEIAITVVADDTNTVGTTFFNTATWEFGRLINIDLDGDGIAEPNFFDPLPGENGVSDPLTIGGPDLVVTKTSTATALNLGVSADFTIDVQNVGSSTAYKATILDIMPDNPPAVAPDRAGTCDYDPTSGSGVTVQLFQADGVTPVAGALLEGTDYSVTYTGSPQCELSLTMLNDNAAIDPSQHLKITYQTQLDADTNADGAALTNVAGATQWFSGGDCSTYPCQTFTRSLSDGTPGTADHEDSYTVTTGLSGYYFQKTVQNLTSGEDPATTGAPGDTLHYQLRVFNVDQTIDNITISDTLDPTLFDTSTFIPVSFPAGSAVSFSSATGVLVLTGNGPPLNLSVGNELIFEFEINLASGLTNGTVVPNQATLSASSGAITADSDDPYLNGIASPADGDPADSTDITIQAPGALSKTNGQSTATIGDQFTYTITVPATPVDVPLYDVRILDDLGASNADLSFVSASVVSGGTWTLSNTGASTSLVIEDTGSGIDIAANSQAVIEVTVQLENTTTNQQGLLFKNSASFTYNRANGDSATQTSTSTVDASDMSVVEPDITAITKTVDNATPTAGDVVRYSVTLTAGGGAGNSDVFDVTLTDTLDIGLAYAGNPTVTVGGGVSADNTISAPDITGDGVTTAQTLVWGVIEGDIDIVAGTSVTIEYDVQVLDSVLANQTLNNSVVAQWTSVDGSGSDERDGSDGNGGLNDYVTSPATVTLTTPDINATINKVRSDDTYGSGDDDVRIGDIVEYTLTVSVPEGTLGNLELVDTLPQGLNFEEVVSINGDTTAPYSAVAPFTHSDIAAASIVEAGDPVLGSTTVTWTLGDVTNQPNDGAADNFVIVYRARVMDSVFAQTNSTALNNTIDMSYDKASGTVTVSDTDTIINMLQPDLAVSKSAAPAGGDILIDPNELINYTVDITNNGAAPAYDTVLHDVIPVGLRNGVATVTMVSTELVVAGTPLTNPTPVYNAGTGVVTWDLDTGTADTYTIPAGDTLRIVYQVQADAGIVDGLILTNAAQVTNYYSFDNDAVPTAGTVSGTRQVYGPSNTATTTLYTGAPPTKALVSPPAGSAEATIGEEIVYQIEVPGTVSSSTLYDVQITDALDANLEFVSANISGGGIGVTETSTATQMNVAVDEIPAGQQVTIELHTRMRNVLTAQQGVDIDNTVSYTYAFTDGGTTQSALSSTDSVTVNIVEPNIGTITKTADNLTPTAGDIVRYTVALTATGGTDLSDVFDVTLTDNLDLGLAYEGNPTVSVGAGVSADNTISAPVITGDGTTTAQTLVWSLANGNADIDIAEGSVITVAYDVRVLNGVLANQPLSNSVVAEWTGIDGADANERTGADGIGGLNDYITAPATETLNTPNLNATINKIRSDDTYGSADNDVRIGDIVEYTVTLSVPEGTLGNVQVVDTLPQGLGFEGVVSVNGDATAPYAAVAPFSHTDIAAASIVTAGDPATGPSTVTWNIGDLTNQPNDGTADNFVVVYRARVLDNVLTQTNSTSLNNTITVSYDTATGTVTNSDVDTVVTVLQPNLSVSKTAAAAGGDTVIVANELVTYTVDVVNSGTAPAYDLVLQDVIPEGMRNGTATLTMVSTELLVAGPLANPTPTYNAATGLVTWNLDTGTADTYTIPAGDTLRLVYQVQADADLGAGLTLTNAATGTNYYSFDNDAAPVLGGVTGVREIYGPTNTATTTLTSPAVGALDKANPADTTVSIGDTFTYRITVPATPVPVTLHDVRILDDLSASAADLSYVSVTKVFGALPWTPENTGTATNLVIEDVTDGIDIPANDQVIIDITVQVDNTGTNVSGLKFKNTATYTYNQFANDATSQQNGLPDTTADMTIVEPDQLIMDKSGPATMRLGLPATFTLDVTNAGDGPAYDLTITDQLPNPDPGGMCDVPPNNITAQIYNGATPVGAALVENTDFTANFTGAPACTLTLTMMTPAAAIPATYHLVVTYEASLDLDSPNNDTLINYSWATQWYSGDTAGAGATGAIRTYTGTLDATDPGTVGTADDEDAHQVITESPTIRFQKYVTNATTGQDPGTDASPGDVLHYRIVATNVSPINVPNFSVTDEVDALNNPALFVPGTMTNIIVPVGADISNTDPNGGANGTGILDVRNLSMDPQGGANDSVTIEFDITLASVIDSGKLALNQANLQIYNLTPQPSDDPNVNGADNPSVLGDEDPTQTLIDSSPQFQVYKTSDDITGSATELLPGDTLRYTITVKNIGDENAVNAKLQDVIPGNTTYVAGTTTLNGVAVADPSAGVSAVESGMLINAPENTTAGYMRADASATTDNVATITFDVMINANVIDGTVISNQGFVYGDGAGNSGATGQQPSDDPDTAIADDPTLDYVGSVPVVDAMKTVALQDDNNSNGNVDPGDTLRYTIVVTNFGAKDATGVTLTDAIPADTTYVDDSVYLNGLPVGQPDNGVSPLIAGIPISSADLTPPLPAVGYLSPGQSATITFDVMVNATTAPGTVISNQGYVDTNELTNGAEPTDADGLDSNGDQPTTIVVGNAQLLSITKEVSVVGGGPALAGGQLDYIVRVTNSGTVPAYDVEINDDIDTTKMTYIPGTGTLNGANDGVVYLDPTFTVDYAATYGLLQPGEVAEFRFRVLLDSSLAIGTIVSNTAQVHWNAMTQNASASADIQIGAMPGVAVLYGRVWHDSDFSNDDPAFDSGDLANAERSLENWNVELYFRGSRLTTATTDASGEYQITGVPPNYLSTDPNDLYELRFVAPGAGTNTAKLGLADSGFNNDLQRIYDVVTNPGESIVGLNLPIDPDGVIYDSISRAPIAGATLTLKRVVQVDPTTKTTADVPSSCFDDPAQQGQVTLAEGFYKFDINFNDSTDCPAGGDYLIQVTPPPSGYVIRDPTGPNESIAIPPLTNLATDPYSVPLCTGDAVAATTNHCEQQSFETAPPLSIAPQTAGTNYHLQLTLNNGQIPGDSQLFNNHIPLDPDLGQAVTISKTTSRVNVTRGELVPYTIVVSNTYPLPLSDVTIVDNMPPGFKYVEGSGRANGVAMDPVANGTQLEWDFASIPVDATYKVELLLIVGSGVHEGEYVNRAHVRSNLTASNASGEASATVRVVPDPTFDCSDIIGKVFDDRNLNGYQDEGEPGIGGARLATARGLLVTTDKHGRFHVTCAVVPNEDRGSNFILKLDERSLPSGYRVTTENPRVQRVTRGKMARFNFGATVHHVVTLNVADGVFQPDSATIRPQWTPRLGLLIEELRKQASVLRVTYLADVEPAGLVDDRLDALKQRIRETWQDVSTTELTVETEVFWRHGGPVDNDFSASDILDSADYVSSIFNRSSFGEDTEKQLPNGYTFTPWEDTSDYNTDQGPKFETKEVTEKQYTTKKLKGLVPPILFKSGKADISDEYVNKLREVLDSMRDRVHVRVHFVGHTDDVKLRGELKRKYEDNMGLSKERAGTTAEFFQRALELPPEAISYEGMGDTQPVASNDTAAGRAKNRRVEVQVWYDEVKEKKVEKKVEVEQKTKRIMVCRVETVCKLRYKKGHSRRAKLKNLVPPFHYDEGISKIPAQYLQQLKQALHNLSSKDNVQMRFIGYTDNTPLTGRDARIYGDHVGLSKANARRVAIAVQEALGLPNKAIDSTGKGAVSPIASNNSAKGRALNRRIEVEFWHDDPLESLPDEPQICPEAAAAETVERIYNPPEGDIEPIYFENGQPVIPQGYYKRLRRAMDDLHDKGNVRLRFIGYTSNKRLDRRTAMVYGDDIGLSTARARRAMELVSKAMNLTNKQAEFEGHGYVQSHDVVNTGFVELERSKVEVQVVYDELAILDDSEGVSIKRITRDVETQNPYALNLMRISVDGQPLNDPNKNIPDVQRCTDVALDKAQVRFKFDNLEVKPRLNVTAWPNVIGQVDDVDTPFVENRTHFKLYTNYPFFIDKAQVRLFKADQSTRDTPLAVVPVDESGDAQWQAGRDSYTTPRMQLKYVLRVYDKEGNFDETRAQTLWVVDKLQTDYGETDLQKELLVGYGENRLGLNNIPLQGGAVRVYGTDVPEGHRVWFAGRTLPVNDNGQFGGEFILPSGLHTVEVAITDESGNGNVYRRDLALETGDWFYVGIADLTVSRDNTDGPAKLVTGDEDHYSNEFSIDGRLAFYAKGKFDNEAVLTASADTREGPVDELFSNFMNKSPQALFRRIDPDYFYPTFGDDSTVQEDAPTSGKLYVKWQKNDDYGLWGNFDIAYLDNDLAHVDRGLYGANANYESESATSFGEKQFAANLFAAEPGTIAGRDEFRGTGGSLYYLRHQDILTGSERVRIETRDTVSGMVLSVKNLSYGLDYDIDYIQGRIMLTKPLSASATPDTVVDASDYGGTQVYLVTRYEYTPGFSELNDVTTGGRVHYWVNDQVKLGMTIEDQSDTGADTSLNGYDVTWRKNAGTWFKLQQSTSQGPVSSSLSSNDGGYNFTEFALPTGTDISAKGQRVDASVHLSDVFDGIKGTVTFYNQQLDAGYAAPGLIALTDTTQTGATVQMPVPMYEAVSIKVKTDKQQRDNALQTEATEVDVDYLLDEHWKFGAGLRHDKREDHSASVPLTQQQGVRSDLAVKATFDSRQNWLAYGFIQDTTHVSGNRDENGRVGVGGDYRVTDRFKLNGELSSGDLGSGAKLGTAYKMTDATDLYSSYVLENERTDNGVKARQGNMTSGFKTRYSDSASIYMEERYTHGDVPTGLTHALGFDFAATDHLNFGANIDVGTLKDNNTGAETNRKALGVKVGYKFDTVTYAGALEYRVDETQQSDTTSAERK